MSTLRPLQFYFMHFMPYPDVAPGRPQGLLGHDCDGCNHSVAPRHETVMSITNFPVARNISDSFDAASVC
jgi:hypothetical protein